MPYYADREPRPIRVDLTVKGNPMAAARPRQVKPPAKVKPVGPEITLLQLRYFASVIDLSSVSKASRRLGVSQPTISQQLARLEAAVGVKLIERHKTGIELTEAGLFFHPQAIELLNGARALADGLATFASGTQTVRVAAMPSIARTLVPLVMDAFEERFPNVNLDLYECNATEAVSLLRTRRATVAAVTQDAAPTAGPNFQRVTLGNDPYVLVTPAALRLDRIEREDDLDPDKAAILNRVIQFIHADRRDDKVHEEWFNSMLPGHRIVARVRTADAALAMVGSGAGISILPRLSCVVGDGALFPGVRLYEVDLGAQRPIIALTQSQSDSDRPNAQFVDALVKAWKEFRMPARAAFPPIFWGPQVGAAE